MRRLHTVLPALCGMALGLTLSSTILASPESTEAASFKDLPNVTLRFGTNAPAKSPSGRAAEKLATIVKEKTNGKFTIKVYPANQLGTNRGLVEQTALGGLDMSMEGIGILGYIDPAYSLLQVPFLFKNQEAIHKVLNDDVGTRIAENLLESRNIRLLSQTWDRLPRQICSATPIRTPEDLNNVLIRTGSEGATQAFELFGAKPASVPLKGVYLALQNNVVSAVDLPTDYFFNLSLYEVCDNLDLVNHTYGTQFVAINNAVYKSLPAAYQKILKSSVAEAGNYNNLLTKKLEDDYISRLKKKGMGIIRLSQEQHDAFSEVVHNNIESIESTWPEADGLAKKIFSIQENMQLSI